MPTQGNTCLEQVLVSVIEQSENASLAKININKAIELINELKATNGISSFKANMDDFWLDLNRIIHPKANFTRITDEQRLWQIKSEKADELSNIFPQLTLPEIVAIRSYASYSEVVNSALYDLNTEKINRYKNYINVLSSALSKVESYDGMVYRTKKISREYSRNKYVVGKIVTETGFISSSHTSFWNHANYSGETTRFFIKSKTGHILKQLSKHQKEKEVLFNIGTSFKVISAKMNTEDKFCSSCFDIVLEEINSIY